MHIKLVSFFPYELPLSNGQIRSGIVIQITDEMGRSGFGEVAPLPHWSSETLPQALEQLNKKRNQIIQVNWTASNYLKKLKQLDLLPSVLFGLESALLTLLAPLDEGTIELSALLMGTPQAILEQAALRYAEGYTSAKLKVSTLSFDEAAHVINQLKETFYLRIDVNRAWKTEESLKFFSQFPLGTFDYVEEPFQNPKDLKKFLHPLAVDESFPSDLSLKDLESLPTLKALIYKPTIQGGLLHCLPLCEWAKKIGIQIVLSSSFESDLGLTQIASLAQRLGLKAPVGLGTYHYLKKRLCDLPEFLHLFRCASVLFNPKAPA